MQTKGEQTLPAGTFFDEQTLPAGVNVKDEAEPGNFPVLDGVTVGKWTVLSTLRMGAHTALYLAKGPDDQADTIIKLYEEEHPVMPGIMRRLMMLRTPVIMTLLGYGKEGQYPYEAVPLLAEGSLEGQQFSEKTVVQVILPQLEEALFQLHQSQLVHNDVKPSNLFWKTRNETIVLGDFGNVCCITGQEKSGGTLAYMAPEVLFSNGLTHTPASDYCSMGITLIALLTGSSPLAGLSEKEIRREWQRGIRCPDNISPQLASLLQDLVRYDPRRRPDHIRVRRWLEREGAVDSEEFPVLARHDKGRKRIIPLQFRNRVILDIHELIEATAQDWNYTAFLLRQHQLNNFLMQFSPQYYQLCEKCAQTFDADEGLFYLLQTIEPSKEICWCGKIYRDLEDFAQQSAAECPLKPDSSSAKFLRLGLLHFYLGKNNGTKEQLDFAVRLQNQAEEDPDLAITQLLITMSEHPEFQWHGRIFYTIGDVADWLLHCEENLDSAVEELYRAKQFEAWLKFIRCGRFLPEIKSKMQEVVV